MNNIIIKNSEVAIEKKNIQYIVSRIARHINSIYYDKPLIVVPILEAAFMFTSDLVKHIRKPMRIKSTKVSSYSGSMHLSTPIIYIGCNHIDICKKDVIIIDTIIDSGNTIRIVRDSISKLRPNSIKVCALIRKNNDKNKDIIINSPCFENIEGFLFGYGTDHKNGMYRNLEHIYRLKG